MPSSPSVPNSPRKRLDSLDYLRGIMAFLIMLFHLFIYQDINVRAYDFLDRMGIYGVSIFFVLSGLSMALVYHSVLDTPHRIAAFYLRRFCRIVPLFWLALLLTLVEAVIMHFRIGLLSLAMSATGLFGFFPKYATIVQGGWSLGCEIVFYFLTPLVFWFYNRKKGWIIFAVSIGLGLYFAFFRSNPALSVTDSRQWLSYISPLNNFFFYCAGISLYYLPQVCYRRIPAILGVICFLGVFFFYPAPGKNQIFCHEWNRIVFSAAAIGLVYSSYYCRDFDTRKLGIFGRALSYLGTISYGVYLLHPLVHGFLDYAARTLFDDTPAAIVDFPATIGGTILFAHLSYRYLESPIMRWGKKIAKKIAPPEEAAAPH